MYFQKVSGTDRLEQVVAPVDTVYRLWDTSEGEPEQTKRLAVNGKEIKQGDILLLNGVTAYVAKVNTHGSMPNTLEVVELQENMTLEIKANSTGVKHADPRSYRQRTFGNVLCLAEADYVHVIVPREAHRVALCDRYADARYLAKVINSNFYTLRKTGAPLQREIMNEFRELDDFDSYQVE